MKNFKQKIVALTLILGALMIMPTEVLANLNSELTSEVAVLVKEDLIGGWEYTVEGAPEGYDKGFMMIVKQGAIYKVQVQLSGGPINAENVVVKGNKITFDVTVEGESVAVSLEAKGSKMTGTSTSPTSGAMNITGIKSISPQ